MKKLDFSCHLQHERWKARLAWLARSSRSVFLISDIYKRADAIAVSALKLIFIVCLSKDDALRFFVSSKKVLHKLIICNRLIVDSADRGCRCRQTRALLTEIKSNKSLISHYFSLVLDVVLLNEVEWTFLSLAAFFVHHQRIRSKIFIFGIT